MEDNLNELKICGVPLGAMTEIEDFGDYTCVTKFIPNRAVKEVLQNIYGQNLSDILYDSSDEEKDVEDSDAEGEEAEDEAEDLESEPYCHLHVNPFENTLSFIDNEGEEAYQAPGLGKFLDHVKKAHGVR